MWLPLHKTEMLSPSATTTIFPSPAAEAGVGGGVAVEGVAGGAGAGGGGGVAGTAGGGVELAGSNIIAVLVVAWSPPHADNSNGNNITKARFSIVTPMNEVNKT